MERKMFIEKIGVLAKKEMQRSGILASLTIAQAILESGWGESGLTTKGNALFGIKAGSSWSGKVYSAKTKECYDKKTTVETVGTFRAYNSWEESIKDHTQLLTRVSRYKKVIGEKEYRIACEEIQKAGYSTDPNYANKLIELIELHKLDRFDKSEKSIEKGAVIKMRDSVFIEKLKNIEKNYKTAYMWGCFGCLITNDIIQTKTKQYPRFYTIEKRNNLLGAARAGAFGFDCVNMIKAVLWGWNGDKTKKWGGAEYAGNGVPDISADKMISLCNRVSDDFSNIIPGEAVWLPGHIGVYIGEGKVIECTPRWKDGVQVSACLNIKEIAGLPGRSWKKHGKIPYVTYSAPSIPEKGRRKSTEEIAKEVIEGKWGNGARRREKLKKAGYDYREIQNEVNKMLK